MLSSAWGFFSGIMLDTINHCACYIQSPCKSTAEYEVLMALSRLSHNLSMATLDRDGQSYLTPETCKNVTFFNTNSCVLFIMSFIFYQVVEIQFLFSQHFLLSSRLYHFLNGGRYYMIVKAQVDQDFLCHQVFLLSLLLWHWFSICGSRPLWGFQ